VLGSEAVVLAPALQDRRVVRPGARRPIRAAASRSDAARRYQLRRVMIPQLLRHNRRVYDWMTESVIQSYDDATADTPRRVIPDATGGAVSTAPPQRRQLLGAVSTAVKRRAPLLGTVSTAPPHRVSFVGAVSTAVKRRAPLLGAISTAPPHRTRPLGAVSTAPPQRRQLLGAVSTAEKDRRCVPGADSAAYRTRKRYGLTLPNGLRHPPARHDG
jgi:hypothetical protein